MNEIRGWISSLWGGDDSHEMEMKTYAYEPILPEILSNRINLRCKTYKNNDQVTSYLYFGLDEGKPYIKVDHHYNYNNNIKEEKFMITSCYAESGRGAWFVEYTCENGILFHFIRIYRTIEMTVKKKWIEREML